MATKRKAAARKPAKRKAAAPESLTVIRNHRFEPGSEVGFYPAATVEVERSLNREPIPDPTATAEVAEDGTLLVAGLSAGPWQAAAQVGAGAWRYFAFGVS
jgi:hypothetical protein